MTVLGGLTASSFGLSCGRLGTGVILGFQVDSLFF